MNIHAFASLGGFFPIKIIVPIKILALVFPEVSISTKKLKFL